MLRWLRPVNAECVFALKWVCLNVVMCDSSGRPDVVHTGGQGGHQGPLCHVQQDM
jgi:hypothetical protein